MAVFRFLDMPLKKNSMISEIVLLKGNLYSFIVLKPNTERGLDVVIRGLYAS